MRFWRRIRRLSLRARLLLITTALLAAALVINSVVVVVAMYGPLRERADGQLRASARLMALLPPEVIAKFTPPVRSTAANPTNSDLVKDVYAEYLTADGRTEVVVGGGSGGRTADWLRLPELNAGAVAERGGRVFDVPVTGSETAWRAVVLPRDETDPSKGSVLIAGSVAQVQEIADRAQNTCLVVGGITLVLLSGVGLLALRGGLRPLRSIEETSAAIAGGDLSRRVPDLAAPRTEIGRLSAALNGMLGRIESAVAARAASEARLRRFVADASHELRTPLAGISGFTEMYRMGALSGREDVDRTMDRIERESVRLAAIVEDLLLLARLDEHAAGATEGSTLPLHLAPMDLRTVAADALHDLRALAPSRPARLTGLDGGPTAPAPVLGDEARLQQVVSNLVGNAIAHTPDGTPVRIRVGTAHGHAVLEVADHGPGLSREAAGRVFERFYRADSSRSRTTGGAGLGLAIVHSLVTAHGGAVSVDSSEGGGATFRISLPVADC